MIGVFSWLFLYRFSFWIQSLSGQFLLFGRGATPTRIKDGHVADPLSTLYKVPLKAM